MKSPLSKLLLGLAPILFAAPAAAQAQTLGPWELSPPDSASTIISSGGIFDWLNVVNNPLTISEAMSSSPIEDAGYANAAAGDVVEVTFLGGVTNQAGADLVMLDSQFDVGLYGISSDFDGFVASVNADMVFGVNVASTAYYYQTAGPYAADVYGVEIDLTDIGVPNGATVNSLRFTALNGGCDPISLAKIGGGLNLTVSALAAGTIGSFDVTGGTAFGPVGIGFSLAGSGPVTVNTAFCGPLTLDLSPSIQVLTVLTADASGSASLSLTVPAGASGATVHFQAVDINSCDVSNGVSTTVL